jgi:hypothetical protein
LEDRVGAPPMGFFTLDQPMPLYFHSIDSSVTVSSVVLSSPGYSDQTVCNTVELCGQTPVPADPTVFLPAAASQQPTAVTVTVTYRVGSSTTDQTASFPIQLLRQTAGGTGQTGAGFSFWPIWQGIVRPAAAGSESSLQFKAQSTFTVSQPEISLFKWVPQSTGYWSTVSNLYSSDSSPIVSFPAGGCTAAGATVSCLKATIRNTLEVGWYKVEFRGLVGSSTAVAEIATVGFCVVNSSSELTTGCQPPPGIAGPSIQFRQTSPTAEGPRDWVQFSALAQSQTFVLQAEVQGVSPSFSLSGFVVKRVEQRIYSGSGSSSVIIGCSHLSGELKPSCGTFADPAWSPFLSGALFNLSFTTAGVMTATAGSFQALFDSSIHRIEYELDLEAADSGASVVTWKNTFVLNR